MRLSLYPFCLTLAIPCFPVSLPTIRFAANDWKPVDPAELALKSPVVEKDADAGFEVDELPASLELETTFGSYRTSYNVSGGELLFTRTLDQRGGTIPVEQYPTVRNFYLRIRAAEQSPVVLARKGKGPALPVIF